MSHRGSDPGLSATPSDAGGRARAALIRRMRRLVDATWLSMVWREIWRASWPATGVVAAFVAAVMLGTFDALPGWVHIAALAAFIAAFLTSILLGLMRSRAPSRRQALAYLERQDAARHRPLSALIDRPSQPFADPLGEALWRAHKKDARDRLAALQARRAPASLADVDPFAVRVLVAQLLLVAFVMGGEPLSRFETALKPSLTPLVDVSKASINAWITPPPYTGKPPIYLASGVKLGEAAATAGTTIAVPTGSKLFVQIDGIAGTPTLAVPRIVDPSGAQAAPAGFQPSGEKSFRAEAEIVQSGPISIGLGRAGPLAWTVDVIPDERPRIAFSKPPAPQLRGALAFTYEAEDDYGLMSARAHVRLVEEETSAAEPEEPAAATAPSAPAGPPDDVVDEGGEEVDPAVVAARGPYRDPPAGPTAEAGTEDLEVELTLPKLRATAVEEQSFQDLTAHPWAGLPVAIQLEARDEAEQAGWSEPVTIVLPQRAFTDPLAKAIVEQRRNLARDPAELPRVVRAFDAMMIAPETYFEDMAIFLGLRVIRASLANNDPLPRAVYDETLEMMWQLALRIEDGDLSLAEAEIRRLEEELMRALSTPGQEARVEELLAQLRQALDRMLSALGEQAREGMQQQRGDGSGQPITEDQLRRMLDTIRELAQTGAQDAARQLLSQLRSILENMTVGSSGGQGSPEDRAMQEGLGRLGDLIGSQRQLLDQTFQWQGGGPGPQELTPPDGLPGFMNPFADLPLGDPSDQPGSGGQGQGQPQPGQRSGQQPGGQQGGQQGGQPGQQPGMSGDSLAGRQGDVRDQLDALMGDLNGAGRGAPGALGRAEEAMREAERALREGQGEDALASQNEAIERLRQGAEQLASELMREQRNRMGLGPNGSEPGDDDIDSDVDPLGRPTATSGPDYGDSVKVPDEIDIQRAREILDELKRRAAERGRPAPELDYLERLLKRF